MVRLPESPRLTSRRLVPFFAHTVFTHMLFMHPLAFVARPSLLLDALIVSGRMLLAEAVIPRPLVAARATPTATAPASPATPSALAILVALARPTIR